MKPLVLVAALLSWPSLSSKSPQTCVHPIASTARADKGLAWVRPRRHQRAKAAAAATAAARAPAAESATRPAPLDDVGEAEPETRLPEPDMVGEPEGVIIEPVFEADMVRLPGAMGELVLFMLFIGMPLMLDIIVCMALLPEALGEPEAIIDVVETATLRQTALAAAWALAMSAAPQFFRMQGPTTAISCVCLVPWQAQATSSSLHPTLGMPSFRQGSWREH